MRWKVNKEVCAGDYDTIRSFSQFASVKELDDYVNSFLYFHKDELSDTAYEIVQYARKFIHQHRSGIGVFTSKRASIAEAIERSVRTVSRAVKQLYELAFFVEPFQTWDKKKKAAGHLVFVINKIKEITLEPWKKEDVTPVVTPGLALRENDENPCESKDEPIQKDAEAIILSSSFSKDILKEQYYSNEVPSNESPKLSLSKDDIPTYIPEEFIEFVYRQGFADPIATKNLYDAAVYSYLEINRIKHFSLLTEEQREEILDEAYEAFRITKMNKNNFKSKRATFEKKFEGFYYGVLKRRYTKLKKAAVEFFTVPKQRVESAHLWIPKEEPATRDELDELGVY
jgi:hypothetical protein